MLDPDSAALLARVLSATKSGLLKWVKDDDGWYRADLGVNAAPILIRLLWIEATNQTGADPYFVEFNMSIWKSRFAMTEDSDGWRAVRAILEAAFPEGWSYDAKQALTHLELKLGQQKD